MPGNTNMASTESDHEHDAPVHAEDWMRVAEVENELVPLMSVKVLAPLAPSPKHENQRREREQEQKQGIATQEFAGLAAPAESELYEDEEGSV